MIGVEALPGRGRTGRRRHGGTGFALAVLGPALAVALVGIQRPAYWMDEATTMILIRWPWPDLLSVIRGPEAPLGPYYLLMKIWTAVAASEWWVRLPSALALAAAVTLAAAWVRRRSGTASALAGATMMLALPAFSRYAQEARPYGLLALAVTCCVIAWWRWCERGGRPAAWWYVVALWAVALCHVLALTVVVAQVVAAALGAVPPARDGRPRRTALRTALHTAGLAAVGSVPVLPYLWLVHREAMGVAYPLPLTPGNAATTFARFLTGPLLTAGHPWWLALGVVALAALGALGGLLGTGREERAVTGFLACWAAIPLLLLILAAVSQETLVPRYFLVSFPAWGLLAGQGLVVFSRVGGLVFSRVGGLVFGRVGGLVFSRVGGLVFSRVGGPVFGRVGGPVFGRVGGPVFGRVGGPVFSRGRSARSVAIGCGLVPLVAVVVLGLPYQVHYRSTAGHGNGDIRPSIALLRTVPYRDLPVVMPPDQYWWVIVAQAYDPDLPRRDPLAVRPQLTPDRHIDLREVGPADTELRLAARCRLALLLRSSGDGMARQAAADFPGMTGFGVREVTTVDGWSVVLLARDCAGERAA